MIFKNQSHYFLDIPLQRVFLSESSIAVLASIDQALVLLFLGLIFPSLPLLWDRNLTFLSCLIA